MCSVPSLEICCSNTQPWYTVYIPDWKNFVASKLYCHELLMWMQILRVLCLRLHDGVFLLSSKLASRSYCIIFNCASAVWLYSVEISDVRPAQVKLWAYRQELKLETMTFSEIYRCKKLWWPKLFWKET